ncbi:hypothetical protein QJ856_gp0312 [Tupanvirus deep ocean]|uniref:Uncharacterized protein n=1 Tax=Tupanvirus soda lake TaxID=2126985 RepID=A0AC59HBV6_9VIRU|nr:hypothetical protein QJ856_gp0312 [Tupanvirus deep ocean]AUL79784.2 hypothetical protein [Tupanvirus deep ocean]
MFMNHCHYPCQNIPNQYQNISNQYNYCVPCQQNQYPNNTNPCQQINFANQCQGTGVTNQCQPICPNILRIDGSQGVTVPSGGIPIPVGSPSIPANSVTPVTGFINPTTNIGGITLNNINGHFTIPSAGYYFISGTLCFLANVMAVMYIYKINVSTGLIELLACNNSTTNINQNPNTNTNTDTTFFTLVPAGSTTVGQTCTSVATNACLNAGDKIFFAVSQSSGNAISSTASNRFIIHKLCQPCPPQTCPPQSCPPQSFPPQSFVGQ